MENILTQANILFLLKGAGISLALAIGALLIGMVIGILMAAGCLSKTKILNWLCKGYVELFRGTPMLLQIMFFYLGVPVLIRLITGTRVRMDVYMVALTALSLNSGAYQCELFRAGIQGVEKDSGKPAKPLALATGR